MMNIVDTLKNFIFHRCYAYRQVFKGPLGQVVLEDLAHFCRANESTFNEDPRISANLDGRREVWLRIQEHLKLSPDEVFTLATGRRQSIEKSGE